MAREVAAQFDADPAKETELYDAFEAWWTELVGFADTSADGQIEFTEWVAVAQKLAGVTEPDCLDQVARAMFRAADTSADGTLSKDEYFRLFGGADPKKIVETLSEIDLDDDGRITEIEFCTAIRAFFLDIRSTTLTHQLLAAS